MTLAVFRDFPGLENGLTKFHDFPGRVVTLIIYYVMHRNVGIDATACTHSADMMRFTGTPRGMDRLGFNTVVLMYLTGFYM